MYSNLSLLSPKRLWGPHGGYRGNILGFKRSERDIDHLSQSGVEIKNG